MSLFRRIGKAVHKTSSFFNHANNQAKSMFNHINHGAHSLFDHGKIGSHKLFGAGSLGSQALSQVSKTANQVGSALGSAGTHLAKFANSDIVEAALGSNPVGAQINNALKGIAVGLKGGKEVAKGVSHLTKQKNYTPIHNLDDVAQNIRQVRANAGNVRDNVRALMPSN